MDGGGRLDQSLIWPRQSVLEGRGAAGVEPRASRRRRGRAQLPGWHPGRLRAFLCAPRPGARWARIGRLPPPPPGTGIAASVLLLVAALG